MATPFFSFKQFTVWHDNCAMKVGTDGVLLGAWVNTECCDSILDVGTGSGVITLMLAQRTHFSTITAIDIDKDASSQASYNFSISPWANRLSAINVDYNDYTPSCFFDLIVSNPPFFNEQTLNPDCYRAVARHTTALSYYDLCHKSATLLNPSGGQFCLIIPAKEERNMLNAALDNKLALIRKTNVFSKPGKPCQRLLLSFIKWDKSKQHDYEENNLFLMDDCGNRSSEYAELTKDFYLH